MKNFKKKALLPAFIMVMVSVIALSSATYAWFTLGQDATVEELTVDVVAASGIQFSLDAATWKSVLTSDEIKAAGVFPAAAINPISTNAKTNAKGRLDFYYGKVNDDGTTLTTTAVSAPEESGGTLTKQSNDYICFDLYVKVTNPTKLYLNSLSEVTSTQGEAFKAARVAFVDQGYAEDSASAITKAASGATAVVWEPNSTQHAAEALQLGTAKDGGISANKYTGVKGAATDVPNTPNGSHTALEAVATIDDIGTGKDGGLVATLEAGINKLTVSIWLEGQDGDCVNSISGGKLNTFLKFTKEDIA